MSNTIDQEDKEEIRESLEEILHVMERKDFEAPPSVRIKIETNAQRVWKTLGESDIDAIYPEYLRDGYE